MAAYTFWNHFVERHYTGHEDKLGDYIYYLGFLFIVTCLFVALTDVSSSTTEVLVRHFGLTLISTLLGCLAG